MSCDSTLITRIYDLYLDNVKKFVLNNQGSLDDAMDLFQDVICVLYQKAGNKNFILSCSLKTYILSIARTLWLKSLKDRKKGPLILQSSAEDFYTDDFYEIYEYNERMFLYRSHFAKLSEKCRRILTLFLEGRSVKEITEAMGYRSEQHTKNRRYRCKKSLISNIRETLAFNKLRQ
jgi:RNA polymerase sigma factor (sigma-70 family)